MHRQFPHGSPREVIERLRQAKGFPSLRALSVAAGISQPTLSRYMAGTTDAMGMDSFVALAECLEVTVSELLGEVPIDSGTRRLRELMSIMEQLPEPERAALLAAGQAMVGATKRSQ